VSVLKTRPGEEQLVHDHPGRGAPVRSPRWRRPRLAALVGVLALALAVAACTGADKPGGVASLRGADQATTTTAAGGSSDPAQAALAYGRCMRQHGIDLPDPQIIADRLVLRPPPKSPKFQAAAQACRQYLPNGGQPPALTAQERQRAVAFARCVRQRGLNMPDPQFPGNRLVQEFPPGMERGDPRVRAAVQACQQFLPADKRGGGGG
jgi:hypothetical protein